MSEKFLKIVHVNTFDMHGGAAKVAWRLSQGQRQLGHQSRLLCGGKNRPSNDSAQFEIEADPLAHLSCHLNGQLYYECQGSHKLIHHQWIQGADLVHFHNLHGGYFNPFSLSGLSHFRPAVWTLHDMQAITGHCAHSFECNRWETGCGKCTHLKVEPALMTDCSAELWAAKKLIYENSSLRIVAPSMWLKQKIERSILKDHPVDLIYNGVDTRIFKPCDQETARRQFNIPRECFAIGAAAAYGALQNPWKGGEHLNAILSELGPRYPKVKYVNIGAGGPSNDSRIINLGHIQNEADLALAYSCLDAFVYTPNADNCPLVILEAMACGLPIVAFNTGGIPELVRHTVDGLIVESGQTKQISDGVQLLIMKPKVRLKFSANARQRAVTDFDHRIINKQYLDLYQSCRDAARHKKSPTRVFPIANLPESIITPAFLDLEIFKAQSAVQDNGIKDSDHIRTAEKSPKIEQKLKNSDQRHQNRSPSDYKNARAVLALTWLKTDKGNLAQMYQSDIGRLHRKVLKNGGQGISPSLREKQIAKIFLNALEKKDSKKPDMRLLLAAMLYLQPYRMPVTYDPEWMPAWIQEDYYRYLLATPNFICEIGELEKLNRHIESVVHQLHSKIIPKPVSKVWTNCAYTFAREANFVWLYFLSHQFKDLYTKRSEIVEFVLKDSGNTLEYDFPTLRSPGDKIKLGVYMQSTASCSEAYATLPVFEYLRPDEFEIYVYTRRGQPGPIEDSIRKVAHKFTVLTEVIKEGVRTIRADDLDILLFGVNLTATASYGFLLANHRLARKQCIHFCNPMSTGQRQMDYFLLGGLLQTESQPTDQYSEAIIELEGAGICFDLKIEATNIGSRISRKDIGVGNKNLLYISGANFFKIIPELQHIWAGILSSIPDSNLLIYPFGPAWSNIYPKQNWMHHFRTILSSHGIDPNRLIVYDTLSCREEIMAMQHIADVYLDATPYNDATSLLDPLEAGLPPVVMEGDQLRFRQGAAILRELGFDELITHDVREYIELAVALGRDGRWRSQLKHNIIEKMTSEPAFLDPKKFSRQTGDVFKKMVDSDSRPAVRPTVGHLALLPGGRNASLNSSF